ncbi:MULTISPECIES: hypothetical protein [unclassified Mycolicibacterium]|uniref:hypothetical protein n=1 Tax=unclassified Mycolicibacterium TaxID=2636767 RepID=UPI0012DD2211|nr:MULTISPECIES: hypothetical protein [unclassified Mycolicibacterium]MUL81561.1 hypothetical protein [Mycolicibacterium sp. CBMA 329]MUL87327.1 hypothetical protein [Mycolicibacterium sp. CBMA 331]MUM02614.1 hypothetical protein [Mycolicibacterium sp. CBMA 334]MUM28925.1 hypothetical protein [Mycolicibacterium sp. CBMA 295]MUM37624.1 hypothetical protein [Mycolicibacterium sp. CBMA 247]
MASDEIDINEAITLYLKHYPGRNDAEFASHFGPVAVGVAKDRVRLILDEAMGIKPDWNSMSLNDAGDYVEAVMHDRHPEISGKSLECIGNYFTYLMR